MHPIIYDVAVSIDGYICGPDGDISGFAQDGPVVDDYMARLAGYGTAIMGRATYEFGYRFGMTPGQNPYPHMRTLVFSCMLDLPIGSGVEVWPSVDAAGVARVRAEAAGPIYLCGGGEFAGALLRLGAIDRLRLKRAPVVLGSGTRLFGEGAVTPMLRLDQSRSYDGGYVFQDYAILR